MSGFACIPPSLSLSGSLGFLLTLLLALSWLSFGSLLVLFALFTLLTLFLFLSLCLSPSLSLSLFFSLSLSVSLSLSLALSLSLYIYLSLYLSITFGPSGLTVFQNQTRFPFLAKTGFIMFPEKLIFMFFLGVLIFVTRPQREAHFHFRGPSGSSRGPPEGPKGSIDFCHTSPAGSIFS